MTLLEMYYQEHATQARQHEDYRDKVTNIMIAVTGVLVGLATYAELAWWSLPAAASVVLLGFAGVTFAGKHYERFRLHAAILHAIRAEMDRVTRDKDAQPVSLEELRRRGETDHYENFRWPRLAGTRSSQQEKAKAWIARQRTHVFWEAIHVLIIVIGATLIIAIVVKNTSAVPSRPLQIEIVRQAAPERS